MIARQLAACLPLSTSPEGFHQRGGERAAAASAKRSLKRLGFLGSPHATRRTGSSRVRDRRGSDGGRRCGPAEGRLGGGPRIPPSGAVRRRSPAETELWYRTASSVGGVDRGP